MATQARSFDTGTPGGAKFLARLHEQIAKGKHSDLIIRVRKQTPLWEDGAHDDNAADDDDDHTTTTTKRQRTSHGSSNDAADTYTDIPALAAILCVRSEYFAGVLSGPWVEAQHRLVEVTVESQQELEDLQLLLKLSCMDTFTHDDGQLLPFATRLRLAVLADRFRFTEAVDEIVDCLHLGIDFKTAVDCFTEGRLPSALELHPAFDNARKRMVEPLISGIGDTNIFGAIVERGVEALSTCLGPVDGWFVETKKEGTVPRLRYDLPLYPFKRLLRSNNLQLTCENETYTLVRSWCTHGNNFHFTELASVLRYHHMTPDFLATTVSQCPLLKNSGLLPSVMYSALCVRANVVHNPSTAPDRSCKEAAHVLGFSAPWADAWEVSATFTRWEMETLKPGEEICKWSSLVAGYPAYICVKRHGYQPDVVVVDNDDEDPQGFKELGVFFGLQIPSQSRDFIGNPPTVGAKINFEVSLPSMQYKEARYAFYHDNTMYGFCPSLHGHWKEAMAHDSPLFIDNKFNVVVHAEYATDFA